MSSNQGPSDTARRTWDKAASQRRAEHRPDLEIDSPRHRKTPIPASQRILAEPRAPHELLDAEGLVGSTVVVPDSAAKGESGGFYCQHCDVLLHDSSAYLNHVNGRAHNSIVGVALNVRRSTADEVRAAFATAYARKLARKHAGKVPISLEQRLEVRRAERAKLRSAKKKMNTATEFSTPAVPSGAQEAPRAYGKSPERQEESTTCTANPENMRRALGLPSSFE
jgi:U4/U6.U5 tri-snRNP component SNU23